MKICFFLILYLFSSLFSNCFAKSVEVDKIIALVNNQVILNSDVNQVLFYLKQSKNTVTIPLKVDFLKNKILDKLIIDTLLLEEADKFNIKISDKQVDVILKNIAFKKHISFNAFKKNIILNNTNDVFSYKDYIENLKKSLKIKMIQEYMFNHTIHIPEKDIYFLLNKKIKKQNKLKTVNLKFIILPFSNKDNHIILKSKKILINDLFKTIENNFNFDYFYEHFKKNKNIFFVDSVSLKPLEHLKELFFDKLNISKQNQILGPILGKKGFYIIKVNSINDNSIKNIVTEYHIQHCFIRPSVTLNDKQAKEYIFKIYNNIKEKHYTFEYAVHNLSHDVYSSHKKGDLGWITNNSFNGIFEDFLVNLNKNEISKPIKSNIGWHIIKLLETRKIDYYWKIERDKIYQSLLQHKMQIEKVNWIKKIKDSSYINKY